MIVVRLLGPDRRWVGSPTNTQTRNPHMAATFDDARPDADAHARARGGVVETIDMAQEHAAWVNAGRPQ